MNLGSGAKTVGLDFFMVQSIQSAAKRKYAGRRNRRRGSVAATQDGYMART